MERINRYASKLISHVKKFKEKKEIPNRKGSIEHLEFIDWSNKRAEGPVVEKILNHDHSTAKIFRIVDDFRYGFEDNIYPYLFRLTSYLAQSSLFHKTASEEFLLDKTFDWIVDSFLQNKIEIELIPYLENKVSEKVKDRTFHFPILNLHIEEPFEIGNAKFQYFTKQYFDDYWAQLTDRKQTKEEFHKLFSKYYGRVVISATSKAEPQKAEEIAFHNAALAMDVFRLFSPAVIIPEKVFKVDLEKRININFSSEHLTEITKDKREISISLSANNEPFYFEKKLHNLGVKNGLEAFSNFIKMAKKDSLNQQIVESISFYSFALSISDLHLRISVMFMIIEGLLLEDEFIKGMQEKVKRRVGNLLFKKYNEPYLSVIAIITAMYKVRHAITHKGKRLPVDKQKLRDFQIVTVELLKKLIILNSTYKNKGELIIYTDKL